MNTEINIMTEDDITFVAALEKQCFSTPWNEHMLKPELSDKTAVFFVAKTEGEVSGYIGSHNVLGEIYISNICTGKEFRNKGIAKMLIEHLICYAKNNKAEFLTLEVRKSNEPAISLYRSFGFEKQGIRKKFYSNPTEDGYIMTYVLK